MSDNDNSAYQPHGQPHGQPIVRAPEIDREGLTWLNTDRPLSLADADGKLLILDFWTYCCVNCYHVLPTLKRVEETFPDDVLVIGVHSPKFEAEKDLDNLKQAIRRYGITHPVVQDPKMELWRQYAVKAWPTLVFVSPEAYVLGQQPGEPDADTLMTLVEAVIKEFHDEGRMMPRPLEIPVETAPETRFSFPGKIKPVPGSEKRWALADPGHHQIVLLEDDGTEIARYGDGQAGFRDGAANEAGFNAPQGLIAAEDAIYVADTGNHAVRRIGLATGAVTTLAGTGRRGLPHKVRSDGGETALASPWDLELNPKTGEIYIANAGTHQLLSLRLEDESVAVLAGTGAEAITDGEIKEATLAQPSGLALHPSTGLLFFADSETSSIRALSLGDAPSVKTLVGAGLFDFGHVNARIDKARFQHPLGVAWWPGVGEVGRLLVADSYNNAVRVIDLDRSHVDDLDDGFSCQDDLCLPLAEPAGLWADGPDRLLVSDSNNHRVLEFDLAARTYRTWAE
ncbi:MAG: thioredoxin-like domain-containing protein [Alphaproteobacteria bacterium]|nr:thioredoxin-like domain-containing protein [Alphaproteobacteria bacterium]